MKEKGISLVGTIFIHLMLALLLLLYYIKPYSNDRKVDELSGVPVMFGNIKDAGGNNEAKGTGNGLTKDIAEPIESDLSMPNALGENDKKNSESEIHELKKEPEKLKQPNKKQAITQNLEQTVSIKKENKIDIKKANKDSETASIKNKSQLENEKQKEEESNKRKNINNQMAGLFGNGSGEGSRGNSNGQGTQGSPSGNSNSGKLSGVGGTGTYDLGGRGVGSGGLKLPSYHVDDYGTVVIDIIVDPQGNVIEATIGKGTNTTNSSLRNESIRAAKLTKFSIVNTTNNQKGTITYKFNLN